MSQLRYTRLAVRKILNKLVLLLGSVILTVTILELASSFILSSRNSKQTKNINVYDTQPDHRFGYALRKNHIQRATKIASTGEEIYNTTYHTDQYHRRTIFQKYSNQNKHLLLFGGSYVFGEGLNDDETLQHFLALNFKDYNVFNYAVHGYGPAQMLAQLEHKNLSREVFGKSGMALYFYLPSHIERASGSTSTPWLLKRPTTPYYHLDRNKELTQGRSKQLIFNRVFLKLKNKSKFLQLININLPLRITSENINLVCKIIAQSKIKYEEQLPGRFFVVMHPLYKTLDMQQSMTGCLKENNINIIHYPSFKTKKEYWIKDMTHPSEKINAVLAKKLYETLSR